ncbi:MAG: hypothetical protein K8R69_04610 [Deltaproteobacteria bacterium]|nr:hypothetical protein [Deltaproteobacteria bacterium]
MFASQPGPARGQERSVRLPGYEGGDPAWTPAQVREWEALQREGDPQFLAASLLNFARSLEMRGRTASAASVYLSFQQGSRKLPFSELANQRLAVLGGRGGFGSRLEHQVTPFLRQATDIPMLLGMTAAGLAFQGMRFATLSRLLSCPEANLLTRGRGALWTASAAGFAAEVPALVFAERGMNRVLGDSRESDHDSLGFSLSQAALELSLLKGSTALGREFFASEISRQTTLLGGILLMHSTEVALGWRSAQGGAGWLLESLSTLTQFHVGAQWSRGLLGRAFEGLWAGLEIRGREVGFPIQAFAEMVTYPRSRAFPPHVMMNSRLKEASEDLGGRSAEFQGRLGQALGKNEDSKPVAKLAEEIAKLPPAEQEAYSDLLLEALPRVRAASPQDQVERMVFGATACFSYVEELNPLRRVTGSFYDSLVQVAFERSLAERNGNAMGSLIRAVSEQTGVAGVEKFLRGQGWHSRYGLEVLSSAAGEALPLSWERAIHAIPMSNSTATKTLKSDFTRRMLGDYFRAYHAKKVPAEGRAASSPHPMDLVVLARGLNRLLRMIHEEPAWGGVFQKVTEVAFRSPVPMLHFDRLFKLLATEGPREKIGDLAFPPTFVGGPWRAKVARNVGDANLDRTGVSMNAGFETGFIDDPSFARKLARFYGDLPEMLENESAARRRGIFHLRAQELWRLRAAEEMEPTFGAGGANLQPVDFLQLLEVHPTATAKSARQAFSRGNLQLQMLPYQKIQGLWSRQEQSAVSKAPVLSLFLPAPKSPTGRPLVVISETSPYAPPEEKIRRALRQVAWVLHEYEHFSHHQELPFQDPAGLMRAEMRASLEELHFLLKNGELSEWEKIRPLAGEGLGIYLRSRVERDYLGEPRLLPFPSQGPKRF